MYNETEQLRLLKIRIGQKESIGKDDLLLVLLNDAKDTINSIRGYKATDQRPLEDKYCNLQVKMALAAYNKMGAEGQKSHTENGITRTYENGGDYPDSLLRQIVPLVR